MEQKITSKINQTRIDVQGEIKKNTQGYGYSYFSNDDILPIANEVLNRNGLYTEFNIVNKERITKETTVIDAVSGNETTVKEYSNDFWGLLIVEDVDSGEKKEYAMPTCIAAVKGAMAIQNYGAMVTFTKRYLFLNFLQVADVKEEGGIKDTDVEKSTDMEKKANKVKEVPCTNNQIEQIKGKANEEDIQNILSYYGVNSIEELSVKQASDCLSKLD